METWLGGIMILLGGGIGVFSHLKLKIIKPVYYWLLGAFTMFIACIIGGG